MITTPKLFKDDRESRVSVVNWYCSKSNHLIETPVQKKHGGFNFAKVEESFSIHKLLWAITSLGQFAKGKRQKIPRIDGCGGFL